MTLELPSDWTIGLTKRMLDKRIVVSSREPISAVMSRIDESKVQCFCVVTPSNLLIGTVSEGDIRRYILKGGFLNDEIAACTNLNSHYVVEGELDDWKILNMLSLKHRLVPVVNKDGVLVDAWTDYGPKVAENLKFRRVFARAPYRISLVGGGVDLPSMYMTGNSRSVVLNSAINKYVRVTFEPSSHPLSVSVDDDSGEDLDDKERTYVLIKNCFHVLGLDPMGHILIQNDLHIRSGMGGSSAMVVACLKALIHSESLVVSKDEIVRLAFTAERIRSNVFGGWQDFVAAVFGGLQLVEFSKDGIQNVIPRYDVATVESLFDYFYLVPIGPRNSKYVHHAAEKSDESEHDCFDQLEINRSQLSLLQSGDSFAFVVEMDAWKSKLKGLDQNATKSISEIAEKLYDSGAISLKICGGGGGGYFLAAVPFGKHSAWVRNLRSYDLQFFKVSKESEGVVAWD